MPPKADLPKREVKELSSWSLKMIKELPPAQKLTAVLAFISFFGVIYSFYYMDRQYVPYVLIALMLVTLIMAWLNYQSQIKLAMLENARLPGVDTLEPAKAKNGKKNSPSRPGNEAFKLPELDLRAIVCPLSQSPSTSPRWEECSIYHLWSDPRGGQIKATFNDNDTPDYLVIEFDNSPEGWAGNVAIRPCGERPYQRNGQQYLCLDFLLPSPIEAEKSDKVALVFRLYDENASIWYYGRSENNYGVQELRINPDKKWTTIRLPLAPSQWSPFTADCHHQGKHAKPEFDEVILGVVIVVGSWHGPNKEPGAGKGKVFLRNIRFE